jgi:SAM-dependent methyltransferase
VICKIGKNPCPVCGSIISTKFFDGGNQPLATLGWPRTELEAIDMTRYPHSFERCIDCTHVWNTEFTYDAIPYNTNPNLMYNSGAVWSGHIEITLEGIIKALPKDPVIVEVGCGTGHFLSRLCSKLSGRGRFIGFDPSSEVPEDTKIEFIRDYFKPELDVEKFKPDLIIMRHILEHLTSPREFVSLLMWGARTITKPCYLFAEVPCIDKVIGSNRTSDFFYEHVSHFTSESFRQLLNGVGENPTINTGYGEEVIFGTVQVHPSKKQLDSYRNANDYHEQSSENLISIKNQLAEFLNEGKIVAIWGGTGKASFFINYYGLDREKYPLVVDSDPKKAGTFVPGSGQKIQASNSLRAKKVDIIIIPTQWRARDIFREIEELEIQVEAVVIEYQGRLVDFVEDDHPYGLAI